METGKGPNGRDEMTSKAQYNLIADAKAMLDASKPSKETYMIASLAAELENVLRGADAPAFVQLEDRVRIRIEGRIGGFQ